MKDWPIHRKVNLDKLDKILKKQKYTRLTSVLHRHYLKVLLEHSNIQFP